MQCKKELTNESAEESRVASASDMANPSDGSSRESGLIGVQAAAAPPSWRISAKSASLCCFWLDFVAGWGKEEVLPK